MSNNDGGNWQQPSRHNKQRRRQLQRERKKDNQQNAANPKGKPKTFTGLNREELSGVVITTSSKTPLSRQFELLFNALVMHAGSRSKGGGDAKKSILKMRTLTKKGDFDPPRPKISDCVQLDKDDKPKLDDNGDVIIDEVLYKSACDQWTNECNENTKPFRNDQNTMVNLFNIIFGQLGPEIVDCLEGLDDWKSMNESNDAIEPLTELKKICHRDDTTTTC